MPAAPIRRKASTRKCVRRRSRNAKNCCCRWRWASSVRHSWPLDYSGISACARRHRQRLARRCQWCCHRRRRQYHCQHQHQHQHQHRYHYRQSCLPRQRWSKLRRQRRRLGQPRQLRFQLQLLSWLPRRPRPVPPASNALRPMRKRRRSARALLSAKQPRMLMCAAPASRPEKAERHRSMACRASRKVRVSRPKTPISGH